MKLWFCWSPTFFLARIKVGSALFAWNLKNAPLDSTYCTQTCGVGLRVELMFRFPTPSYDEFKELEPNSLNQRELKWLVNGSPPWLASTGGGHDKNQTPSHSLYPPLQTYKGSLAFWCSDSSTNHQKKHVARIIWNSVLLTSDICLVLCLNHRNSRPSVHNPTPRFAAISCHAPSSPSLGQVLAEQTTWFLEKPSGSCPFSGFPALLLVVETAKAKQAPRSG